MFLYHSAFEWSNNLEQVLFKNNIVCYTTQNTTTVHFI